MDQVKFVKDSLKWYALPKHISPVLEKSSLYIHSEYLKKQIYYWEYYLY